jgi:hypothetical protein
MPPNNFALIWSVRQEDKSGKGTLQLVKAKIQDYCLFQSGSKTDYTIGKLEKKLEQRMKQDEEQKSKQSKQNTENKLKQNKEQDSKEKLKRKIAQKLENYLKERKGQNGEFMANQNSDRISA